MDQNHETTKIDVWSSLRESIQTDLEQYRKEMKEIDLMLEQSQFEVKKLAQKHASITAHIQQVQSQFDTLPRSDIKISYENALDAQQRLFVMRGQVEKLQSDRNHLHQYISLMEEVLSAFEKSDPSDGSLDGRSSTAHTVELIVQAQEAERQRLSRQMHDGPAQALSNFILQTEIALRLFELDQEKAKGELESLKSTASTTFQQVRDFIFDLRPMMLDDLGLVPTIKRYIDSIKSKSNMDIRLMVTGKERRLEPYQEVLIFRAIQELLNNAIRHSQAKVVKAQVDLGDEDIKINVDDDGQGFEYESLNSKSGMGLKVIGDRIEMLGGKFSIDSLIGQGTRITIDLPAVEVETPT